MNEQENRLARRIAELVEKKGGPELMRKVFDQLKERLYQEYAMIYYAGEMDSTTREKLEQRVAKRFPDVSQIKFEPDPGLIAGIKVVYRDYVYEDSVQEALNRLLN